METQKIRPIEWWTLLGLVIAVGLGTWWGYHAPTTAERYLALPALGVRLPVGAALARELVVAPGVAAASAGFSSQALEAAAPACAASAAPLGIIERVAKADVTESASVHWTHNHSALRAATLAREGLPPLAKEFDDFYLVYIHPPAPCLPQTGSEDLSFAAARQLLALVRSVSQAELISQ